MAGFRDMFGLTLHWLSMAVSVVAKTTSTQRTIGVSAGMAGVTASAGMSAVAGTVGRTATTASKPLRD